MSEFFHAIDSGSWEKPEVFAIAEQLGISQGDAFLGCLCMWDWFRRNSTDGSVSGVTSAVIDRQVRIPGFSAAAIAVRWLEVIEGGMRQPGFEFHLHGIESLKAYRHRIRAKRSNDKQALIDALRVIDPDAAIRAEKSEAHETVREKRTKRNVIESKENTGRAGSENAGPVRSGRGLFLKTLSERAKDKPKVLELIVRPVRPLVDDHTPVAPLQCFNACGWEDRLIDQLKGSDRAEARERLFAWFRRQLAAPDPVVDDATAAAAVVVITLADETANRPGLTNRAAWFRSQLKPDKVPGMVAGLSSIRFNAAAKWIAERLAVSQG